MNNSINNTISTECSVVGIPWPVLMISKSELTRLSYYLVFFLDFSLDMGPTTSGFNNEHLAMNNPIQLTINNEQFSELTNVQPVVLLLSRVFGQFSLDKKWDQ